MRSIVQQVIVRVIAKGYMVDNEINQNGKYS